jgi:outer membrane receptor protein involved in Fe transport
MNRHRTDRLRDSFGVLLASIVVSTAAHSQTAPATAPAPASAASGEQVVKLEAYSVTGSNIKRVDVEDVLPVTVVDASMMDIRGASEAADLLTALPEITGLPGNETASAGATARGDNATVSLRGLPSSNTLILLDGRRVVPHPISQSEAGVPTLSVNVNQMPNQGIDHIDILRDGASSIYGTDAVAGVINYQMNKNFRGEELALHWGETKYHDGEEYRATATVGRDFDQGKGRVMVVGDFYDRGAIFSRSRPFSENADNTSRAPAPWNVATDTTFNLLSSSSAYGSYILGTPAAYDQYGSVTTFTGARPTGVPSTYASSTGVFYLVPLAAGGVGFATAAPARTETGPGHDYYWNNSAYRVIQPESKRTNVFTSGEFDLTPSITAFTELSIYQAHSTTYREPDVYSNSSDGFMIVPATNPYNPFGTRFWDPNGAPNADGTPRLTGTPTSVSITTKRFTDLATRTDYVTDDIYRAVGGLRGKLWGSWTWEAALMDTAARGIEYEAGATRRSLLAAALNQTDPTKAFNPFGQSFAVQNGALVVTGPYTNPQSVISTFQAPFIRNGITKLDSGDFHFGGDVLSLWGGNKIGAAFGGELRYEGYDDYRPPYAGLNPPSSGLDPTNDDFVSFSPNSDTHGERHVGALYAETLVPLVGNQFTLPLVKSLELSASVRFEDYTTFGSATKPKFGVDWKPLSWIKVRASFNEGFHAPNLDELFTGKLQRIVSSTDTYRSIVTGLPTDGPTNRITIAQGNLNLKPETSTGKTAGIVVDVPFVKGLSLSADYWEIAQKNVIVTGGGIAADTAALQAATQAALASGQNINSINLGSGTANYLGDPSVVRLPVTATDIAEFAAYNATQAPGNQRAVVGAIAYIDTSYFNEAKQFVNGFDFDMNYHTPKFVLGQFTFDSNWTLLNDFHAYSSSTSARIDYRASNSANIGGATPPWRGTTTLSWTRNPWGAGIGLFYVGRYTDVNATTTKTIWDSLGDPSYIQPVWTNGAFSYRNVVHDTKMYNVFVSYRTPSTSGWISHTLFRVGVNNVLDAKPPLVAGTSQGFETSLYTNMARGRTFSTEATKTF